MAPEFTSLLMQLQHALMALVNSPGNLPFPMFRAFKNQVREEAEPYRSVDGELVERFLDLDEDVQQNIATWLTDDQPNVQGNVSKGGKNMNMNMDLAGLRNLVESLKRFR